MTVLPQGELKKIIIFINTYVKFLNALIEICVKNKRMKLTKKLSEHFMYELVGIVSYL